MIPQVEKWRELVKRQFDAVMTQNPQYFSLKDRFKTTITDWSDIFLAIIQKESSGNEKAVGDDGRSIGLMQLNYAAGTPQGEGYTGTKEGLFDPATNIFYGIKYFLRQLNRYNDLDKAILAYNAGSYRTTSAGIPINKPYLDVVLFYLSEKKTLFPSVLPPSEPSSSISDSASVKPTILLGEEKKSSLSKVIAIIFFVISTIIGAIAYFLSKP